MLKPTDRLRKYRDLYRLTRREDGIWYLLTRYPDDGHGMTFDVYEFSDTHQAACLPPQTGASLLKRFPEVFTLHQDAEDAKVLLFPEEGLHDLADVLGLRRKRKLSDGHRQKLVAANTQFRFTPGSESEKTP